MKRFLSFVLGLVIFSSSTVAFANGDMASKISGHWSENILEKDFVSYYFPYLAKNNFEKLNPNENIIEKDFALSLGSLSKDYNLNAITNSIIHDKEIKRIELVNIIGERLGDLVETKKNKFELPFKDINNIEKESIESIRLLYSLNMISGVSAEEFAPDKMVTQAEAIVILQKMKGVLEDMKEIHFDIKGVVQSYNSQENIIVKEKENSVLVTITKQFASPGYSLGVGKIKKEDKEYKVVLDIVSPNSGTILPQVITYKTITIEVDKSQLNTKSPYNFTVEGIKSNLLK